MDKNKMMFVDQKAYFIAEPVTVSCGICHCRDGIGRCIISSLNGEIPDNDIPKYLHPCGGVFINDREHVGVLRSSNSTGVK